MASIQQLMPSLDTNDKKREGSVLDVKTGEGKKKLFLVFSSQQHMSNEEFSFRFALRTTAA